jgi:Cellulase (glycosyl hydrolase family 5)
MMRAIAVISVGFLGATGPTADTKPPLTITADGVLLKDGKPYRAIGINYFSAFSRRLADANDTSYREGFAELVKHGIPFVRFMATGFWPNEMKLYQEDPEAYWTLMDDVVRAAEEHGLGLVPSLFWYNACIPDLVGEPLNQWGNPDSKTIAFVRQYTEEMVTRYADSPAIWAWELGNEYSLAVDLPNAADHRPWIHPNLGTPETRSEADDMRHDMLVTALTEFGKTIRKFDKLRPVTSGNSLPRNAQHHMRTELSWTRDTREEFAGNLIDVNPDPLDLVSVHIYPFDHNGRFDQEYTSYDELLDLSMKACAKAKKVLFVGEFGAPDDEKNGGRDPAKRESLALLTAIERSNTPLAALWNFDLPSQESFINVTPTNHRGYLLDALGDANKRIALFASGAHKAELTGGGFSGRLLDNKANAKRQGAGFNPLHHAAYPGQNLFSDANVGLNFEHVFNGIAADKDRAMFTPRKDPCELVSHSDRSATVHWPSETSSWGLDCTLKYTLAADNAIDLEFAVTPTREEWGQGYLAIMWASYMNHTRDRLIHFYGKDGDKEGWVQFGVDTDDGFETGTIRCDGAAPLPYEEGAQTLNLIEHPTKTFLEPFYYGLVDGDGKPDTQDDTMAYIMMFDQNAAIRFAMWNFAQNAAGDPDPHSPAWDWQFVIRGPKVGTTYRYRARVLYVPFTTADDIRRMYRQWQDGLRW